MYLYVWLTEIIGCNVIRVDTKGTRTELLLLSVIYGSMGLISQAKWGDEVEQKLR